MDWDTAERELGTILTKHYHPLVRQAFRDASADAGQDIAFNARAADRITRQIGARAKGITATQRERVQTLVSAYEGEDRVALEAALAEAADGSAAWAGVVAQTEVYTAYNSGYAAAADEAGYYLDVSDGDGDAECASWDGRQVTPDEALANPLGHPNCQRVFSISDRPLPQKALRNGTGAAVGG